MSLFKTAPTSVDGVLSAFKTAIADLETVASAQRNIADRQQEIADAAQVAKANAVAEAERATKVASQMTAIFN